MVFLFLRRYKLKVKKDEMRPAGRKAVGEKQHPAREIAISYNVHSSISRPTP